jgi:hypothetical protein
MLLVRSSSFLGLVPFLCLMWPAASQQIGAQTFTTLYTFGSAEGDAPNGSSPSGNLAIGPNGVIYGTTVGGGGYTQCPENDGQG